MKSDENPVNAETARAVLGLPGKPWPRTRLTAIKKAMGITGRFFFVSDVRQFLRKNRDFKVDQWKKKTVAGKLNDGDQV